MRNSMRCAGLLSRSRNTAAGFTLVELLVAMLVFGVISAAAFGLMAQNQPLFSKQQGLSAVNIAIRNAAAQIQLDVANGGSNYYNGINIPNWPVGVVVVNNTPTSNCQTSTTTYIYGPSCFDSMNVIASDPNTPPTNVTDGTISGCHVTTGTTVYLSPSSAAPAGSGYPTLAAATAAATNFKYPTGGVNADQILFVKGDGSAYTTTVLTATPTAVTVGGRFYVQLTHGATVVASSSTNNIAGTNSTTTNDPLQITVNQDTAAGVYQNTMLKDSYCASDYVLRLTPILYSVDTTTNPSNPTLIRQEPGSATTAPQKLAEQIIGFKVMATLINDPAGNVYHWKNSDYQNNYTLVRSVRISIIGRTTPVTDPTYRFRNTFDTGPYQIQGISLVINPRNMSMGDN